MQLIGGSLIWSIRGFIYQLALAVEVQMPGKRFTPLNNYYFLDSKTVQMFPLMCKTSSKAKDNLAQRCFRWCFFSHLSTNASSLAAQGMRNTHQGAVVEVDAKRQYYPCHRKLLGIRSGSYMGQQFDILITLSPSCHMENLCETFLTVLEL